MAMFEDIRTIYQHLEDDISKKIFEARLNFSATGDARYITMLPTEYRNLNADIESYYRQLLKGTYKRTVIFGAGFNGESIAGEILIESVVAFIDNYRNGEVDKRTNLPVFSLESYISNYGIEDTKFIVSVNSRMISDEMRAQLLGAGVNPKDIVMSTPDYRNNTSQYFDLFVPGEHETFVDCGCFDGSTAFRFAGWCGEKGYDRIWCFEPDRSSFEKCKALCENLGNCQVYPYGISDQAGSVSFASNGKEDARIVNTDTSAGADTIETIRLDDFLKDERVSFIKMDIEGSEFDAVRGVERIIKEQKPRLAISVYHKSDDFITIPRLILAIRPDYKLYIRHYSLLTNETILYAC